MKITVIGAGHIGSTLGMKWAQTRHEVCYGVRQPADSKFDALRLTGSIMPVADSLNEAEVVLIALPGAAVEEFAAQFGANLGGKIVIDAANNMRGPEMNSLAVLKQHAPGALLVRAFSTLGWENFASPQLSGETIDLFYCGHAQARATADQLIASVGLRPVYVGEVEVVALVDGLTRLWFALAFNQGRGRRIAFKLLHE